MGTCLGPVKSVLIREAEIIGGGGGGGVQIDSEVIGGQG